MVVVGERSVRERDGPRRRRVAGLDVVAELEAEIAALRTELAALKQDRVA